MLRVQDEKTEWALWAGTMAALIWGIGLSLYGLRQGPEQTSWITWGGQLLGGIVACIVLPPAFVRGRDWVLARLHQAHGPLHHRP